MDIIQIDIPVTSQQQSEVIIAELSEIKFHGFQEADNMLSAFIEEGFFTECTLQCALSRFNLNYTIKLITESNWNEQWEKEFSPVIVDSFVAVRAEFHSPIKNVEHEIIITPKMSFGTGHHETTHMMIQHLLKADLTNKSVLDMVCGTGVLAILAEMKGAKPIDAIDYDNWCYLNSSENVERNKCAHITVIEGDATALKGKNYDVIIANINRNILLNDMQTYVTSLNKDGVLFLSGFYNDDIPAIQAECEKYKLKFEEKLERNNWVSLKFLN